MIDLIDPVQRHIAGIAFRDAVVPDDASDMTLRTDAPSKQVRRQLRALLPGVDFPWGSSNGLLDDPVGRRVGRVAFNPAIDALWWDGVWTGGTPAPHRLPEDAGGIERFIRAQTLLGVGNPDDASGDDLSEQLLGFSIGDHARTSDILRANGWRAKLFVAASMIAAACASYETKRRKSGKTGRNKCAVELAALNIEAAVISAARIATDIYFSDERPVAARRIAMLLAEGVERFRRARATKCPSPNLVEERRHDVGMVVERLHRQQRPCRLDPVTAALDQSVEHRLHRELQFLSRPLERLPEGIGRLGIVDDDQRRRNGLFDEAEERLHRRALVRAIQNLPDQRMVAVDPVERLSVLRQMSPQERFGGAQLPLDDLAAMPVDARRAVARGPRDPL